MSKIEIYTDGCISVGGTITGYCVSQDASGTQVRAWHNNGHSRPRDMGEAVKMPQERYALATDAGHEAFCRDFLAAWNAVEAS